jgi:hypothetical protein
MEAESEYRVVAAERLNGDLIIHFNDGKCALFEATFLHSMLSRATAIDISIDPLEDSLH